MRIGIRHEVTGNRKKAKIVRIALCALLIALGASILCALCSSANAQERGRVYRIGFLFAGNSAAVASRIKAFREELTERGYVEGRNLILQTRYGEGKPDRMPALATELLDLPVDVIVTAGPVDTRAAKRATSTLPIVMAQDSDPIGSGFVASLARPGGNITGLSTLSPEISGKQLDILKEIVPRLSRVSVLGNSTAPGNEKTLQETQLAAGAIGVRLQYFDVRESAEIASVFAKIENDRVNAMIVLRNPVTGSHRKRIIDLTGKHRLPAMFVSPDWVESGGLMSYSLDVLDNYRRAATYVDRILKGTRPAELPVEQPKKFEFVINLKTAKQIGLTIPPNVLARADRVIR